MALKTAFERNKAVVSKHDDELTPLEIAAALETDAELPFAIAPLLRSGQRPVGYVREVWSEDASYYTSRKGAKSLIVAFTAQGLRLGVPISFFLQMLRDDAFDAVVLRDPGQLHYTRGVRGLGGFLESMARIRKFAEANGFDQIITFGNSLGGLPALRAGRLLGARRAFSIGGRYPWHPGRLLRGETPVPAFDPLCACASRSPTQLVSVYARGNEIDANANARLKRTFPECEEIAIDIGEHGIIPYFYRARLLPLFLACLLDYWDEVGLRTDLLARLEDAARHSLFEDRLNQSRNEERLKDIASKEQEARRLVDEEREARRSAEEALRNAGEGARSAD